MRSDTIEAPIPFTCHHNDGETVTNHIQAFFDAVLASHGLDTERGVAWIEVITSSLARITVADHPHDRITFLMAIGQVIATVIERRDELDYVAVLSAAYAFDPARIKTTTRPS